MDCGRDTSAGSGHKWWAPPRAALLSAVLGAVFCHLMWPGNTTWLNDEPLLFREALAHNRAGTWAQHGLLGTRGIRYGPVPTWLYQAALRVTHDLPLIVLAKSALSLAVTLLGVWGFSRRLRLGRGGVLVLLCATSPYLWLYHRMLWDNVWLVPLSSLLMWALVSFLDRPGPALLLSGSLLCGLMLGIHPISAAYVIAVGGTVACFRHRWLLRHWRWALAAGATSLTAAFPFLAELVSAGQPRPRVAPSLAPLLSWLLGGSLFSGCGLSHFYGPNWLSAAPRALLPAAGVVYSLSAAAVPLTLWGICAACRAVAKARPGRLGLRHRVFCCVAAAVLLQGSVHILFRLGPGPHYFNASWPCYLLALGYGLRVLGQKRWGRALRRSLMGANLACLAGVSAFVQWTGGNRTPFYGTVLSNQVSVARALNNYSRTSEISIDVPNYVEFPHALHTLTELYCDPSPPGSLPHRHLHIGFVVRSGYSGRIVLTESPSLGTAAPVTGEPEAASETQKGRN